MFVKKKFTTKSKTGKVEDGQKRRRAKAKKQKRERKRGFVPELLRLSGKNSYFV
jgi:hypothetical protein